MRIQAWPGKFIRIFCESNNNTNNDAKVNIIQSGVNFHLYARNAV